VYYYIVNPASGRGQIKNLQDKLRDRLDALGIRGEWAKTTGPDEAGKMAAAAEAKGHTTIVAVGGDDTVNEVINGTSSDQTAIGIIPLGTANHLAGQLGITSWQQACEVLAARRLTSYGLIAAGQKFFLSTLTMGFETDLDKTIDTTSAGVGARINQLRQGWGHARQFQTLRCRIKVDDSFSLECDLFSLSIANQKFLNPLADNKLIVSLSDRPGQRQLGSYLWQLVRHGESPLGEDPSTRFLADRVVIETDPVTGIMVDGKVAGRTPIAIRLTDRRVRFITEKVGGDFKAAVGGRDKAKAEPKNRPE
jgi:diacylglycerol kinase family enzyme